MRSLYALGAEAWVIARWLFLKLASVFVSQERVIELGNVLFRQEYPLALFEDYAAYCKVMGASLAPYVELYPPKKWLQDKDVLDVGSGLGQYSDLIRRAGASRVVSLEIQAAKANFSRNHWRPPLQVVTGSAEQLPFSANSFDVAFSNTVFEHLPDIEAALASIREILRHDGVAVIGYNFIHHRGGHHLFPYIHFPWPLGLVDEEVLCRYWSSRLSADQKRGEMRFYPQGCSIKSLSEGAEIHLNRKTYDEFEEAVTKSGMRIVSRMPSEQIAKAFPKLVRRSRFSHYLSGTIYYVIGKNV